MKALAEQVPANARSVPLIMAVIATTAAVFSLLILTLSPRLSLHDQYRIDPADTRWIKSSAGITLRRPLGGERQLDIRELPRGGGNDVQIFYRFSKSRGAERPTALLLPAVSGTVDLFVNGAPIFEDPAASHPRAAVPGSRSELIPIAASYYHNGINRIDLVIQSRRATALLAPIYLGPAEALRPVIDEAISVGSPLRRLIPPLALLTVICCAAATLPRRSIRTFLPAAGAVGFTGLRVFTARPDVAEALGSSWPVTDRMLLAAAILSLGCVSGQTALNSAAGRYIRLGLVALVLGCFAIAYVQIQTSRSFAVTAAGVGVTAATLAAALTLSTSVRGHMRRPLAQQIGGAAAGTIAALTTLLALWGSFEPFAGQWIFWIENGYLLGVSALITAAAAAAVLVLVDWTIRSFRERFELSRLVSVQRQELDRKARALQLEVRQRGILEERQRLARDMHDGIGGQLTSLIARMRLRRVDPEQIERELVAGLAELRLIVDSLDAAGDSLAESLAIFRARTAPQLEATGIVLHWSQEEDLGAQPHNPRWLLNVYRILQEAVSNVLRHSGADELKIQISLGEAGALMIEIVDNGIGFDPENAGAEIGKGIANMTHRAQQLGGTLSIEPLGDRCGTKVQLYLPRA